MEQLVFGFYREMLEQEEFTQLTKAAITEDCYDKKNYPRCLEDLTDDEMKEIFGENTFNGYKEDDNWDKIKSGHLVVLRRYKKADKTISIKKIVLNHSRDYQREMICDIIGSCLMMPEKIFYHHIFKRKNIKQLSHIFQYPAYGVKLRLIEFYYDNVIRILERYDGGGTRKLDITEF